MRIFSSILIICFALPLTIKLGVMVDYQIRYDYYVNVLCENQNNEALQCNGKCALMKDLKITEQTNSPEEPSTPTLINFEYFIDSIFSFEIIESSTESKHNFHYLDLLSINNTDKIDHPPQFT